MGRRVKLTARQVSLLSDLRRLPTVLEVYPSSTGAWMYRCFGHQAAVQDEADGRTALSLYRRGLLKPIHGQGATWPERMFGNYTLDHTMYAGHLFPGETPVRKLKLEVDALQVQSFTAGGAAPGAMTGLCSNCRDCGSDEAMQSGPSDTCMDCCRAVHAYAAHTNEMFDGCAPVKPTTDYDYCFRDTDGEDTCTG